ncbi:MAG TPA: low temperature requirement protein A [Gemmatimonadales bacterium]|nr:low temperature requirement protein A [Gemmatimonadales bacterium]
MTTPSLLRDRHGPGRVGMVELFFDLIFVFAITQLSHKLLEHFTPAGALETGFLALAVWWVWIYTTWAMNWLDPARLPVRLCLFALMLLGIVLSASIPEAFGARGLAFGMAYAAMQTGRGVFTAWAMRTASDAERRNFVRIAIWLVGSGVLWVVGGLAVPEVRIAWWGAALGLELLGPWVGFRVPFMGRSTTGDWHVSGQHMTERCALFIIIALGEALLVTGGTFSGLEWTGPIFGTMVLSFLGTAGMWWLYFDVAQEFGTSRMEGSQDPGRVARFTYTYVHVLIVAGIIALAVADEFVLAHPTGHANAPTRWAILGGTGFYLLGNLLFRWGFSRYWSRTLLVSLVLVGVGCWASFHMTPWLLLGASSVLLLGAALVEGVAWRKHVRSEK